VRPSAAACAKSRNGDSSGVPARPANQTFIADDGAAVEVDDRLEHGGQLAPRDQVFDARCNGLRWRAR
jgi:hypothetical protein